MIRLALTLAVAAQTGPIVPHAAPPAEPAPLVSPTPAPPAPTVPPPIVVSPPSPVPATAPAVVETPAPRPSLNDLTGALGFGVGIIPNAELAGTTGAVSIKYWVADTFALAPLFSFAYTKPNDSSAAWHLRPEVVALYVPFSSRWTRFQVGGGLGFQVGRAAATTSTSGVNLQPNTVFTLALPIQAGVEHFFARWFSMGIAARTDLFSYSEDGSYHEVSFSIDSTSLLGQLFFYTD